MIMTTAHTEVFSSVREVTNFINANKIAKDSMFPPFHDKGQWFLVYFTND